MSNLTAIELIPNNSFATTGLFNQRFSTISANFAALNSDLTINFPSGETLSVFSNIDASGRIHAGQQMGIGATPSAVTTAVFTIAADSSKSDYIHFEDTSGGKSNYLIGSRVGGTADGLNIWDLSGDTMLMSISKQSIRFYQNVVGPVFDVGGALADTYNAATFGTGADSLESRIQAAISQASTDGVSRVYIPANMYPYSAGSVSFDTRVQMVREGGNWAIYDVQAYGASGDGVTDDSIACQSALTYAPPGAVVHFPSPTSRYRCSNLTVFRRLTVTGDGRSSELFNNIGGPTMVVTRHPSDTALWNSENQLDGVEVSRLFFSGIRSPVVPAALRLKHVDHSIFEHLVFEGINGAALQIEDPVRECTFVNITTRWCGSSASTGAITFWSDTTTTSNDGSNALVFIAPKVIFSHGPGLISSSTFSTGAQKLRKLTFIGAEFHGMLRGAVDFNGGTPPDSSLTHPHVKLVHGKDVFFINTFFTAAGQGEAHINLVGGGTAASGVTNVRILGGCTVDGHTSTSTGTVTTFNSGLSVNQFCQVYLAETYVGAVRDVYAVSGSSVHFGPDVDLIGTSSISSTALEPAQRLTGVFAPRSGQNLIFSSVDRVEALDIVARSTSEPLRITSRQDNAAGSIIIRTPDGSGTTTNRFRFDTGSTTTAVLLSTNWNWNQNRVVSYRTQASLSSTNMLVNEMAFAINASGASLAIRSNGTIYYFTSSASTLG